MTTTDSGLIGYSGFVGGTLDRDRSFAARYNSSNIESIQHRSFDRLICAGTPGVKWQANRDPESDRSAIARLVNPLSQARAREFILISTIDVYPDPSLPHDEESPIDSSANHAYGKHRFQLEQWAQSQFETVRIIRLPAVFGYGLKKNAIFDLLNHNQVDRINPAAVFQWYAMENLAAHIDRISDAKLAVINLFTEPMSMRTLIDRFFPNAPVGPSVLPAPNYRLRTRHSDLFEGPGGYVLGKNDIVSAMARFIDAARAESPVPR